MFLVLIMQQVRDKHEKYKYKHIQHRVCEYNTVLVVWKMAFPATYLFINHLFIILNKTISLKLIYCIIVNQFHQHTSQLMRLWYLSHKRPVNGQASLRIHLVSPEPSLFAHIKYGNRWRLRPKIRHLAPLDGCACAFEEWVYGGQKVP